MSNDNEKNKWGIRDFMGVGILLLGFGFVITYISISSDSNSLNIILPVVSTWVGTIIAFYFSKENFEAANASVKDMVDKINPLEKLKKVPIKDVMIPFDKIKKYDLPDGTNYQSVLLVDILAKCTQFGISRIPIIQSNKVLSTVIHRSIIDLLISKYSLNPDPNKNIKAFSIQDLITDPETTIFIKTQLCIKIDATLLDAKSAYDNEPNVQDVFITQSGSITDPILGWVTENEIIKYLKG